MPKERFAAEAGRSRVGLEGMIVGELDPGSFRSMRSFVHTGSFP